MPEIKRLFNASKMNRDLDDRLVPPGEYREALNINVSKSEGSDMGAVENLLGNILINTTLISNATVIGSYRNTGSDKIYYYITSNDSFDESNSGSHQIIEYDQKAEKSTILVDTSSLNFHKSYPITGINIVDNLLFWTDNRNAPRKINVQTALNEPGYYNINDIDNLASVAKYTPFQAPEILSVGSNDEAGNPITSNFLENKLVRFSYRWQFEDGEYSTLAPFTPICFSRLGNADAISSSISDFGEIETFVNAIKSVQLSIPTPGGFGITNAELIYKETGSSTLYVVEDKSITTETSVNFFYKSQDPFKTLPPDQLTRVYDAVPRVAKSQELAGGRLIYGNLLQNYNIPNIDFTVTRTGESEARYTQIDSLSVKSRRTYQVGIVLADKFGRQSPVILSNSGGDTVFIEAGVGEADSITAFNALRIAFSQATINTLQELEWAYSYRIVVKQREQEYYNWISIIDSQDTVARLGDSINKIPRDQTAVIPPSTSATISPTNISVFPKILSSLNQTTSALTKVRSIANPSGNATVSTGSSTSGLAVFETKPVESDLDIFYETSTGGLVSQLTTTAINVEFFNCYLLTFQSGTHIETNRLRAGFNETAFDVGVRAFVVQENFAEERRFNTLIHSSGLFNSRTNINYINQFNESEGGLTISLDPHDGFIQKLFADDTQIVIFQEDKISRSPINKNFIYSAEGGAVPVTSNTQFLGTIAPYAGEFGISDNPESFATFGFAKYFTDKNRGSVLRLSQDGITEISNSGMSDFFRDALKSSTKIIGSYDEYHGLYNLTIVGESYSSNKDTNVATSEDNYFTISFDEGAKGWTSFKSFNQESGISLNNTYYTFYQGKLWQHNSEGVTRNNFYNLGTKESYIEAIFNDAPSLVKQFNTIGYEGTEGWNLDFINTDISSIGVLPTTTDAFNTILKLQGVSDNSILIGERSIKSSPTSVIQWVIFVEPKSSDYKFTSVNDVTLTGNSNLTVTNPSAIVNNKLAFLVEYTVGNSNSTQTLNVGGIGASLAFTVALLTINTGDSVSNASVSPAVQTFTTSGINTALFTVDANNNYYIEEGNISINTSGLSTLNAAGISGTENKSIKVVNYSEGNRYTVDNIKQNVITFTIGKTYTFDQSDSSNVGHPIRFSTTNNGTHGGGSEYTTGVTYVGTPGQSGASTSIVITSSTPLLYYYCSNHSLMGGSTNIIPFNYNRSFDNVQFSAPITVPNNPTNNTIGVSGSAVAKYDVTWLAPNLGTLTPPVGVTTGVAYKTFPYDSAGTRQASIRFTASGTTKVLLADAYDVSYNISGTTTTKTLSNLQDTLDVAIEILPIYESNLVQATISGNGEVNAALGVYPSTHTFATTSPANLTIGDVSTEQANINILVTPSDSWILINGSSGPQPISSLGQFTIGATDNDTGSQRMGTVVISNNNGRVTGISSSTINITQS
jgi:hypothetical protein